MVNHKTKSEILNLWPKGLAYLLFLMLLISTQASANTLYIGAPLIYNVTPQAIPQGQTTTVIVTGENLPNTVGVSGGDVYAVISRRSQDGKNLAIQLSTTPTALGPRELIFINQSGVQTSYPFQVIPSGSPIVDNIIPGSAYTGDNVLVRLEGKNLTKPFVASLSEQLLVVSSRSSTEGNLIDITLSVQSDILPGTYPIIVSTPYGQTQASFTVLTSQERVTDPDFFNADPYSPGIFSIDFDPQNKRIVLKGSMFDPDPAKNTVTLLESSDGSVIGRQVQIESVNDNEIVIDLPEDLSSDSISFAVSSADGKSSNIKSIDLSSILNNSSTSSNEESNNTTPPDNQNGNSSTSHIDISTIANNLNQGNSLSTSNTESSQMKNEKPLQTDISNIEKPDIETISITHTSSNEDNSNLTTNIQNLSNYLFSTTTTSEIKLTEDINPSINEIKDPAKLISTIEENKQLKNQANIIMLALGEAKSNEELAEALKKTENLKTKVIELEKLLGTEKQKNNPNPKILAKYEQLIASANAESKSQTFALLNNLLKYKPQLKNLLTQKPFDLAAIQPNIPDNSVIVQYVPTDEGLIIFVVDNKNLKTRINKNITKEKLNKEIQAYRQLFEKEIDKIKSTGRVTPITNWKDDKSISYKKNILPIKEKNLLLYNTLIQPIEKDIADKKHIAIIANGWLRYLPFQSLAKSTKDGDLNFLISQKSIVYLDSVIAISKDSKSQLSGMSSITVFANPDGTLDGANKEAELITKLFNTTTKIFVKRSFNIALINQLAQKADILHLATHGHLDGNDIDSSYLVTGKKQTGKIFIQEKLFLKDIYDLNLKNSKLVVLSGCDTGKIGNLGNEPDDIVGSLATAFRVAGANTILASLWKAHDEATKIIMQSFYENLKAGVDKAEALRKAELKLKENPKYGHPLFWSLFNLIGDWR